MKRALLYWCAAGLPLSATVAQPCGNPWTLHQGPGPSARSRHATTYDSIRGKVILFGGGSNADTWEWTAAGPQGGGSWALRATSGPPALRDAGLVFDSVRQKTVLFGGANSAGQGTNQTWEWDGVTWQRVLPGFSPPPMSYVLMAYDAGRQRTVLVSTYQLQSPATYEFNGANWTPTTIPTPYSNPLHEFSLAYDAARSRLVMTGFVYHPSALGISTFELEPTGWIIKNFDFLPYVTAGLATTYDPLRSQVVYVDSRTYSRKTALWSYQGAQNTWLTFATDGPPLTSHRRPVFDAAGGQLLVFGGQFQDLSGNTSNQTWLYRGDSRGGPILTDVGVRELVLSHLGPSRSLNVATSSTGPVTYQWRLNQIDISDGTSFQGSATATLTINPEDYALSGYYDCIVTDACGTSIRPFTLVRVDCYASCTGVGAPTAQDFICFITVFNNGCVNPNSCYANCDGSTVAPILTANDFMCYITHFIRGCN